jgi:(E)-4-hydroxy-3-methylbut-2-enyl-diphosphate synthase
MIPPRRTRTIHVRDLAIGGGAPIAVQSMAATRTQDVAATMRQVELLESAGADLVRIAVDSKADVEALAMIRSRTKVRLSVDLQENYRLAELVAPYVDKLRYNPGHLHHHEKEKAVEEKVRWSPIIRSCGFAAHRVNAGSIARRNTKRVTARITWARSLLARSITARCSMPALRGYRSIKDSDPRLVVEANERFAEARPDVPLHLGVTEAGLPPDGVIKTRIAFEQLLARGIGDTIRVSLTVPFEDKGREIVVGREILADIEGGRFRSVPPNFFHGLNIIACPSCSRVENERFIELAADVKRITAWAAEHDVTIAVMGCRVNGPGETDDTDLGLWCGPTTVNLKRGPESLGSFSYDEILPRLEHELEQILGQRRS